jgi:hypothetical protein
MATTVGQTLQLEKLLEGVGSAHDAIKAGIGQVSTAEWNLGQLYGSVGTFAVSYTPEDVISLRRATILRILVDSYIATEKSATSIVANWPVAKEFEGLATDACVEFCNSHGLLEILRKCLNQARVVFSNIAHLSAELDFFRDEEIEDSTHVVIRIEVNSDQRTVLSEYNSWVNWVIQNISPDDSNFFTLTVQRM